MLLLVFCSKTLALLHLLLPTTLASGSGSSLGKSIIISLIASSSSDSCNSVSLALSRCVSCVPIARSSLKIFLNSLISKFGLSAIACKPGAVRHNTATRGTQRVKLTRKLCTGSGDRDKYFP